MEILNKGLVLLVLASFLLHLSSSLSQTQHLVSGNAPSSQVVNEESLFSPERHGIVVVNKLGGGGGRGGGSGGGGRGGGSGGGGRGRGGGGRGIGGGGGGGGRGIGGWPLVTPHGSGSRHHSGCGCRRSRVFTVPLAAILIIAVVGL